MNKARFWLLTVALLFIMSGTAQAALGDRVLRYGDSGSDVYELQQKLQQLGLLGVSPTGYFGPLTQSAIKQFQINSNLVTDGLAGPQTIGALSAATNIRYHTVQPGESLWLIAQRYQTTVMELKASNRLVNDAIYVGQRLKLTQAAPVSRGSFSRSDLELLARLVHAEAQGEPHLGKVAVAAVVFNRVDSPLFPNTLRGVIYEPYQFEPVLNGTVNHGYDGEAMQAVTEALGGKDPTSGSLFFYNPWKVTHKWLGARPVVTVIGQHVFLR